MRWCRRSRARSTAPAPSAPSASGSTCRRPGCGSIARTDAPSENPRLRRLDPHCLLQCEAGGARAKELALLNADYAVRNAATVFDTMDDLRDEASANRLPIVLGGLVDAAHQFA